MTHRLRGPAGVAGITRRSALIGVGASIGMGALPRLARSETAPLRMAYSDEGGAESFRAADGRMLGILVESMDLVAREAGIEISHHGYPWLRAQAMVRDGELDGFCTVRTAERESFAHFAETPVFSEQMVIFHRRDDPRPAALAGFDGLALLSQGSYLGNGWAREALKDFKIDWTRDQSTCLKMLANGRFDVFVSGEIETPYRIRELGLGGALTFTRAAFLPTKSCRFGLRRSFPAESEIVPRVDAAIAQIRMTGAFERIVAAYR
jgi:polar amino acid transport system substrate-binding protein